MREELTRMLDQYDVRRRADTAREEKTKDDDAQFLERFARLRREVARPVFEAAGAMLVERGHGFRITEEEYAIDATGKVSEAAISFHIVPAGLPAPAHADHARSLSLTTRHYNRTVWVNTGRPLDAGGVAGAKGALAPERITRALLEQEVVKLVGAVMAG